MAAGSKKVIYAALLGNAGIAVTKFAASLYTGSSAMLTEAVHSLVDTGNQVILLWGLRRGKQPPDERFPFGHGKEVYFWCLVVAILLFAGGAGISLYEGIRHLMHPEEVSDYFINYIVLIIAMIFEAFAWYFAWKGLREVKGDMGYIEAVRKGKDPTYFVVLFEDSAAMLGLIVAFVGLMLGQITGNPYFDGGASVVIGLILAGVAIWLAYESKGLLIGEAAHEDTQRGIRDILGNHPALERVNELATLHMGPESIIVTISADFRKGLNVDELEGAITDLNRNIKATFPAVHRVFIEAESWAAHKAQSDVAYRRSGRGLEGEHDDEGAEP